MEYVFAAKLTVDRDGGLLVTFPDVPDAITHGADHAEARRNAAEALGKGGKLVDIPVEASDALKIAVIEAFQAAGISKAEFARRLGKAVTEAQRILDPDHPTKLAALTDALSVLGKEVVVSVKDAA